MPVFAVTIFVGAFLLFQVQPLIGKYILPWFGGGPGVWTACMLFFQVVLVGGYAYAHLSSRWLRPRAQALAHLALLGLAMALLPITPGDAWKPHGSTQPIPHILALLAVNVGLPYFVLSATGPLLQHWFSLTRPGVSPYRLYALSNAGSLLALLSYPFFFEPQFSRRTQAMLWMAGLGIYAAFSALAGLAVWRATRDTSAVPPREAGAQAAQGTQSSAPGWRSVLWLLLPACASVLLLATTNKLCQDLAPIPFLWVLPLALYLLSFIICFDSPRWYARTPYAFALLGALAGYCWAIFSGAGWPLWQLILVYSIALFTCCMVCHGELYRLRPAPRQLTGFYLMVAVGGALGGVFVAAAPLLFTSFYELHIGILLCGLLFAVACACDLTWARAGAAATGGNSERGWRWLSWAWPPLVCAGFDRAVASMIHDPAYSATALWAVRGAVWSLLGCWLVVAWIWRRKAEGDLTWRGPALGWMALGVIALGSALWMQRERSAETILEAARNFYGRIRVFDSSPGDPDTHLRGMVHGRIVHGTQFVKPELARRPTLYYGEQSGVGLAFGALPPGPRRIGLVGLGVGTLTAYAQPGDSLRVYEINPDVERMARKYFTFLSRCPGKVETVLGDARLALEREPSQQFDVLALDAFSSDAIPVHLLTREAFALYDRHLMTNGVIAVHISNQYLDLEPVVRRLAQEFGYSAVQVYHLAKREERWMRSSAWMLLSRNQGFFANPAIANAFTPSSPTSEETPLWTDDFASLYPLLK